MKMKNEIDRTLSDAVYYKAETSQYAGRNSQYAGSIIKSEIYHTVTRNLWAHTLLCLREEYGHE
jgi:hypothetical protein